MALFRKKPVVIEAITFAQLVQHGRDSGANIVNGIVQSIIHSQPPASAIYSYGMPGDYRTARESPNKPSVMRESPQHLIRAAHEPDELFRL